MSRPHKPWLDWRRERDAIAPLLQRRGGVLSVRASTTGPLVEFANALRSHLEHGPWERGWRTIQFDPDNSNTRYFGEMTRQIERSLGMGPSTAAPVVLGGGSKLGADLSASAITITNSFNLGQGEYEQSVAEEQRARRIVEVVRTRAADEPLCFLFLNSDQFGRGDLARVVHLLWQNGLEELRTGGFLLVDLSRVECRTDMEWPPTPDVSVTLSDEYDSAAREHATLDLATFLLDAGLEHTDDEARAYSRAMLDSHKGPTALYARLAAISAARAFRD